MSISRWAKEEPPTNLPKEMIEWDSAWNMNIVRCDVESPSEFDPWQLLDLINIPDLSDGIIIWEMEI